MSVHPSGYYAWRSDPASPRAKEDQRLLGLIKHAWLESSGVYGYRKITHDLRDLGECCGKHHIYRLMRQEGMLAIAVVLIATGALRWSLPIGWNRTLMSRHRIGCG